MRHSRVLVYGAGVIGTFYAELLAAAGEDVSLLARGRRLELLRSRKDITILDRPRPFPWLPAPEPAGKDPIHHRES